MFYTRRGLSQDSVSRAKLVQLKLSSEKEKHGKQATFWIRKNACSKLAVKMITTFKERPHNTEFRIIVLMHTNKNTTINYMF